MKKLILSKIRDSIKNQYPKYSDDKIDEIMYGVEGLYLTITKAVIIFTLALILGIFKELLILLLAFNFIRLFAFGMHASNSVTCLIFSSILFLGCAYLCKIVTIPREILYSLYILAVIMITVYAPADTVKRPLIKKKKRIMFKILSVIVAIIYLVISLFIKNNLLINSLIIGLLIECLLIIPVTYKAFKMPYKNYKNYGLNT